MTLAADIAIDFATAQTDWHHTISFRTPSLATGNTGTETETLGDATEVLGVWQPWRAQRRHKYEQLLSGLEGRPEWLVLAPLATSVAIGGVAAYLTETGEVMAIDSQPGHKELILKERKG